jgi:hypothetical protein
MLPGFVDHVWQSTWVCGCACILAFVARHNCADLRLSLWRIALVKFMFPFTLLVAMGEWLGFPIKYPEDPAPAVLTNAFAVLTPFASPARAHAWSGGWLLLAACVAVASAGACIWWLRRRLNIERERGRQEAVRRERDNDDLAPPPGFVHSALLTACALAFVAIPVLAGATDDRQSRHQLLIANAEALRNAPTTMKPAAPGMGQRHRIDADALGVSIRNVTVQELAAIAYGVNRFFVRGQHFYEEGEQDWLIVPRYDVRVTGRVLEPDKFDPFALRARITRMLAERHGLEIYVNSKCQPPCGKYGVPMPPDPL